ncbi:sensor histidine kinase [Chitinophaga flava]|uniref:Signal transduction histidine kinase internal region domain-containing protein n=1 Tax=Chitinophaga flava TaxID=2259036 RepID=A0A365XU68_9BACT|nr:histidine kinase [Chitinophaga flava]RBL89917.1 hypothetical protein DF182_25920 [Chitinophaga flava]
MKKVMQHIRSYGIILVIVTMINIVYNFPDYSSGRTDWITELVMIFIMTSIGFIGFKGLNHFFLQHVLNWNTRTEKSFLVFILVSACFGALLVFIFMKLQVAIFHTPQPSIDAYIKNMIYSALLFLLFTLGATFGKFINHWKQGIEAAANVEQLLARSQLESLKNQVNPHFLFNALNTLTSLIREDEDQAVSFVGQLSRILRYALSQETNDTVLVQTELKIADAYMKICQQRFKQKLVFEVTISDMVMQQYILSHSILMLLENALKHNEISRQRPLVILMYDKEGYLFVENNYQPRQSAAPSNGIGLSNITGRYRLLTHLPVLISSDEASWRVGIPVMNTRNTSDLLPDKKATTW